MLASEWDDEMQRVYHIDRTGGRAPHHVHERIVPVNGIVSLDRFVIQTAGWLKLREEVLCVRTGISRPREHSNVGGCCGDLLLSFDMRLVLRGASGKKMGTMVSYR